MIKFTSWDEDGYDIVTYHIHPAKTPLVFMENEDEDGTKNYAIAIAYYTYEADDPIVVDRETFERVMREYNRYLDRNATMSTE